MNRRYTYCVQEREGRRCNNRIYLKPGLGYGVLDSPELMCEDCTGKNANKKVEETLRAQAK